MNIVDDKTPVVDFAISSAGAARGKLVKGQSVLVNGTTFGENAADVAVRFAYGDGAEATATVTGCGENLISVAWPDELSVLPDGTEVSIVVIRPSGSATYVSTPPLGNRRRLTSADFTPPAAHAPTCAAAKAQLWEAASITCTKVDLNTM